MNARLELLLDQIKNDTGPSGPQLSCGSKDLTDISTALGGFLEDGKIQVTRAHTQPNPKRQKTTIRSFLQMNDTIALPSSMQDTFGKRISAATLRHLGILHSET